VGALPGVGQIFELAYFRPIRVPEMGPSVSLARLRWKNAQLRMWKPALSAILRHPKAPREDALDRRHDVNGSRSKLSLPKERGVPDEVFEHLPHGIAVSDRVGALLAWNRALERILRLEDDPLGRTCCELFGCGTPNGPQGGCLTEQAIRAGGRPLEGVIQRSDGTPLWITVAPLRDDGSRLVFEVRRAPEAGTTLLGARVTEGAQVQVFTLGRTEVLSRHGPLSGDWLEQRTGQLLKYLTCERHRVVPTEEIAESFSGNARPSTLNTVRYFIHALRKRLEPGRPKHGQASVVLARRGGYTLNDAVVWIDADEFERHVNAGVAALARGERAAAADHFEKAVSLYRGDFLADEPYADWALTERERLRALVEKPLRALSEFHTEAPDVAALYLERLAQMEPFDGGVQRELLSLWVRQGRLSRAVRHYQAFQQRLLREFGGRPEFSLSEIVPPSGTGASVRESR
jgi:DNA-binding SARP family transcriptional activator